MSASNEKENWRIFIAVPLPESVKEAIAAWSEGNKRRLEFTRWVNPHDYHITVQFLGDVSPKLVPDLEAAMTEKVKGMGTIHLHAAGCGVFGRPSAPRVLWAGTDGEINKLTEVQAAITSANRKFGFVPEDRPYRPHITIARKYPEGKRLPSDLIGQMNPDFGAWEAEALVIYRTRMNRQPMYEKVGNILL